MSLSPFALHILIPHSTHIVEHIAVAAAHELVHLVHHQQQRRLATLERLQRSKKERRGRREE